ncbi:protein-glutamate O-methyltransferase [Pararhizobium haloflavum]|uniref:protein-glutamate O-methyltransferase n=1 Tax=Pararhizobium haloflavum TaxID=2037914 RepID=UPI000C19367C|nr:protein-glutamate O-methyltransferase [Pararhizobium haloflavum]
MTAVLTRKAGSGGNDLLVDGEFPLTRRDLSEIAAMIYADAGIALNESKASLVYSRLSKRIRQLGLADFAAYCALVGAPGGEAERREMLSFLTTNFTRFFRENHHFDHLRDHVLPPLLKSAREGGRVRIWSAGCSDGQEPYSIALTALSLMPEIGSYDFRILASDIDPKIIAKARAGVYDDHAVETVPAAMRKQWLRENPTGSGGRWSVGPQAKALIAFRELNLLTEWPFKGPFQVIFCRNVVIYFDEQTQARVWGRYCDMLAPGGHLYIGHSERLSGPAKDRFDNIAITTYRRRTDDSQRAGRSR